ncbi:hypothetical protein SCLCIDRAFT_1214062 [Scleroderma citrinum Foug A]|uniref:Uncharacterized protein n=1 Tax=Scleroderma citrinum Foug A TaxID=1036808 RepID=A0A0C2ZQ50_9AGAM|nr:hypothetical protein SCLCIDRAFT_1214062 [Scleroderma citrinum Foug A]
MTSVPNDVNFPSFETSALRLVHMLVSSALRKSPETHPSPPPPSSSAVDFQRALHRGLTPPPINHSHVSTPAAKRPHAVPDSPAHSRPICVFRGHRGQERGSGKKLWEVMTPTCVCET